MGEDVVGPHVVEAAAAVTEVVTVNQALSGHARRDWRDGRPGGHPREVVIVIPKGG